jgi:hypothetical protein
MTDMNGPDAWPAGAFMSVLIVYGAWMGFRYWTQEDEDESEDFSDYDDDPAFYPPR